MAINRPYGLVLKVLIHRVIMIPTESILSHKLSAGNECQRTATFLLIFLSFRKRWLLFPPASPLGQLQTRIPYEESSVYIDVEPSGMNKFQVCLNQ